MMLEAGEDVVLSEYGSSTSLTYDENQDIANPVYTVTASDRDTSDSKQSWHSKDEAFLTIIPSGEVSLLAMQIMKINPHIHLTLLQQIMVMDYCRYTGNHC